MTNETDPTGPTGEAPQSAAQSERCDPRVLELLVCPITKASLAYDEVRQELISRSARLAYPIRSGVPHMLPSDARPIDDAPPASARKP